CSSSVRRPPAPPRLPCTTLFRSRPRELLAARAANPESRPRSVGEQVAELVPLDVQVGPVLVGGRRHDRYALDDLQAVALEPDELDRKSTRLNSSHQIISYAVFCL